MKEIKCPHCHTVFSVEESEYQALLKEIRTDEFEKALHERLEEAQEKIKREAEVEKDKQQKEIDALNRRIQESKIAGEIQQTQFEKAKSEAISEKEKEIERLKSDLALQEEIQKRAILEAVSAKEEELQKKDRELMAIKGEMEVASKTKELEIESIKETHRIALKEKEEEVAYYKDLKARMSTKLVGESLEQHCQILFEQIRAAAYPHAYFEKDNDASSGSKGDFIFRDYSETGEELISIMFEMKNETDGTSTKKKNEDFFKELDKDRKEKKCEYAVLVSLLEPDSELYNGGIVDVSHRYQKMYVVRPQCFLSIISILRNAALSSASTRHELQVIKEQNIDIVHFEENLHEFQAKFGKNFEIAASHFKKAIEQIDKTIAQLTKIKEELTGSGNQLRLANDKAQGLTIKKLTHDAPSVAVRFAELKKDKE